MEELLKKRIQKDAVSALKEGKQAKRLVLNMLLTAIKNKELEKRAKLSKEGAKDLETASKLTDEEIVPVIFSEVKKRNESAEAYESAGRQELAAKEKEESAVLKSYLPEQLSKDELRRKAAEVIKKINAQGVKDMGRVMSAVMAEVKGHADGGLVSEAVKEELSK